MPSVKSSDSSSSSSPSSRLPATSPRPRFLLRSAPALIRLGLTFMLLVMLGGLLASGRYLRGHYDNRDGVSGLTMDDFRGAYHGVEKRAPMLRILEEGHADPAADANLSDDERATLLDWLRGERISGDYDNFDLGESAPAEIIARDCLACHTRGGADSGSHNAGETGGESGGDNGGGSGGVNGGGAEPPLEYWDDVQAVAYSKSVAPTDLEIMYASLHTHALSLATLGVVVLALAIGARGPRWLIGGLAAIAGLGLLIDLGSWLLARDNDLFVWAIVAGGIMFCGATAILIVIEIIDLWWPMRRSG